MLTNPLFLWFTVSLIFLGKRIIESLNNKDKKLKAYYTQSITGWLIVSLIYYILLYIQNTSD